MKLLIAIPSLDYVNVNFMESLVNLIIRLKNDGVDFDVKILSGTLVYVARDNLARHAINNGFTHVLWLDADMVFNDDILEDLMFNNKDFITGMCHARRRPYMPCVFKSLDNIERFDEYPSELFEVGGCGFACVLISVSILLDVMLHFGSCFLPTAELGEDLAFCKKAKTLNHRIYCDPHVVLGHIGHVTIYPEDHRRYMAELEGLKC